jgi:amino acid transporter
VRDNQRGAVGGSAVLIVTGARPLTKVAAVLFVFQVLLLLAVAFALLVEHSGHINAQPLIRPTGIAASPACRWAFRWRCACSWAGRTRRRWPKSTATRARGVTRAASTSILVVAGLYVFLTYATVVGFNDNAAALSKAQVPFITAAGTVAGSLAFVAYLAGFTFICSCLIAATNSQARIIFNSGREGCSRLSPLG